MKEIEFPMPMMGLLERHSQINVAMLEKHRSEDTEGYGTSGSYARVDVMFYENAWDFIEAPGSIRLHD